MLVGTERSFGSALIKEVSMDGSQLMDPRITHDHEGRFGKQTEKGAVRLPGRASGHQSHATA